MKSKAKNNYLFGNSISKILRSPVSSKADLEKLSDKLGLSIKIDWLDNYKHGDTGIYNIDADHIGGSHWISIVGDQYFDPLGLPIARDNLNHLQYTTLPIQNFRAGGCGLYALLFIYYAKNNDVDGFFNLFY